MFEVGEGLGNHDGEVLIVESSGGVVHRDHGAGPFRPRDGVVVEREAVVVVEGDVGAKSVTGNGTHGDDEVRLCSEDLTDEVVTETGLSFLLGRVPVAGEGAEDSVGDAGALTGLVREAEVVLVELFAGGAREGVAGLALFLGGAFSDEEDAARLGAVRGDEDAAALLTAKRVDAGTDSTRVVGHSGDSPNTRE